MSTFNEWAADIHKIADEHGFWPPEGRNFGEMIALMHSEVTEAWDEWEGGKDAVYQLNGKPEGIAVELIDCIIRCLDTLYFMGADIDAEITNATYVNPGGEFPIIHGRVSKALSDALEAHREGRDADAASRLCQAVVICFVACLNMKVNVSDVMEQKIEYNRNRPHKHGKAY